MKDRFDRGFFSHGLGSQCGMIHNDHLGIPQKMTDSAGSVVWSADYKPFGEASITVSTIINNLRGIGQYYDVENGLLYNYFRDLNPTIGRYVEADRIGLRGGINLYVFVRNKPTKYIDPRGLAGAAVALPVALPSSTATAAGIAAGAAVTAGAAITGAAIVLWPSSIAEEPQPQTTSGTIAPSSVDQPAPNLTGTPESCNLIYQSCMAICDSGCQSSGSKAWCKTKCWFAYLACMLGNM